MKKILILATAMALPFSAYASNFNYSSVGVSYVQTHLDDAQYIPASSGVYKADKLAGVNFNAGWQFHEEVFLRVDTSHQRAKSSNREVKLSGTNTFLSLGGTYPVGDRVDLGVLVSYGDADAKVCVDGACNKIDGGVVRGGVFGRIKATSALEFTLDAARLDYRGNNLRSENVYGAEAGFNFNKSNAITVGARTASDANEYSVGYRYTFQ